LSIREAAQSGDGIQTRPLKVFERGSQILSRIVPLGSNLRAVEALQDRALLAKNPPDTDQVAFAFQVSKMAGLFKKRKASAGGSF
jgi:hypothetical protein